MFEYLAASHGHDVHMAAVFAPPVKYVVTSYYSTCELEGIRCLIDLRFTPEAAWFYPAFFTCVWLWLYAGSGFLLKAARRFDIGFEWFNSKVDIEKHPLSSIGLVAGALVALMYWTISAASWLLHRV